MKLCCLEHVRIRGEESLGALQGFYVILRRRPVLGKDLGSLRFSCRPIALDCGVDSKGEIYA
jgi:hypothetical protein